MLLKLLVGLNLSIFLQVNGESMLEGFYCGQDNCYDVLGVTRDKNKGAIAKAYRKLAKIYHPDLYRDQQEKLVAEENFKRVANAYEILKDEESRMDYDYMLDNPDEFYSHFYRYYRRRVAPRVDVRVVLVAIITIISAIQYGTAWQRYRTVIYSLPKVPKYRNKALQIAKEKGLLKDAKKGRGKNKSDVKEETEDIIRKVIEDNMDIKGAYAKPVITDVLWLKILLFPYDLVMYVAWYTTWMWNHNICNKPYNDEEKLYLIRTHMAMGPYQFAAIEESEKQDYLKKELWVKENFETWFMEQEEIKKVQLAANARYKAYRRFMKTHGSRRIVFDDS